MHLLDLKFLYVTLGIARSRTLAYHLALDYKQKVLIKTCAKSYRIKLTAEDSDSFRILTNEFWFLKLGFLLSFLLVFGDLGRSCVSMPAEMPVTLAPVSMRYCLLVAEEAAPDNK